MVTPVCKEKTVQEWRKYTRRQGYSGLSCRWGCCIKCVVGPCGIVGGRKKRVGWVPGVKPAKGKEQKRRDSVKLLPGGKKRKIAYSNVNGWLDEKKTKCFRREKGATRVGRGQEKQGKTWIIRKDLECQFGRYIQK